MPRPAGCASGSDPGPVFHVPARCHVARGDWESAEAAHLDALDKNGDYTPGALELGTVCKSIAEKYNAVDGSLNVSSEYEMPPLMGWTAGVYASFLDVFSAGTGILIGSNFRSSEAVMGLWRKNAGSDVNFPGQVLPESPRFSLRRTRLASNSDHGYITIDKSFIQFPLGVHSMNVPAGEFKAKCLKMMEDVRRRRVPLTITKRGKPIARLVPVDEEPKKPLFGIMSGTLTAEKDIVAPTGEVWDADT